MNNLTFPTPAQKRAEKSLAIELAARQHCEDQLLGLSQTLSTDISANHQNPTYPRELVYEIVGMLNQIRHDLRAREAGQHKEALLNTLELIKNS